MYVVYLCTSDPGYTLFVVRRRRLLVLRRKPRITLRVDGKTDGNGFSARHSRREYGYYERFRGSRRSGPERHYE